MSTRPEPSDEAFLWDIRRAAEEPLEFTRGRTLTDYLADRGLQLIVERELEIIGEAATLISAGFGAGHAEIPPRAMVSQRNVAAHAYGEIDQRLIWQVGVRDIPALLAELERIEGERAQ